MRDLLASLLQVSYAAKECGDDLNKCVGLLRPLLETIRVKKGSTSSLSSLLCTSVVKSVQLENDLEWDEQELQELDIPSQSNKMGSSLIEKTLNDHTLGHVFSFLNVKDVCTSIERTSHRFLQVSRQRRTPFEGELLGWMPVDEVSEDHFYEWEHQLKCYSHTPFDELIFGRSGIPKAINMRALKRFHIQKLKFDPTRALSSEYHKLDFREVVDMFAKDIEFCQLSFSENSGTHDGFFPLLPNVEEIELCNPSPTQFDHFCQVYSEFRGQFRAYLSAAPNLKKNFSLASKIKSKEMRDLLASLLQVSYAAKECGDDLSECVGLLRPLLEAIRVKKKSGSSLSSLLCGIVMKSVQFDNDLEWDEQELQELDLPSHNDEMGSSLIERTLDDHTLGHVFNYLKVRDVCKSIERTSHRFLQVSRQRRKPFKERYLEWMPGDNDYEDYVREWEDDFKNERHTPFERLIFGRSGIPKAINMRALKRFHIQNLYFDPTRALYTEYHKLDFREVINVFAKDVCFCEMSISEFDVYNNCGFFPLLPNVEEIHLYNPNPTQFDHFCQVYSEFQGKFGVDLLEYPFEDYSFEDKLPNLEEISLFISECSADVSDRFDEDGYADPSLADWRLILEYI